MSSSGGDATLHVEGDIARVQQRILARFIILEDWVVITEGKGIELRQLANAVTGIVRSDSTFMDLIKTIFNVSILFQKDYHEKLVATRTLDILTDMMGSDFLTGMSAQFYYRYIQVAKRILKLHSILSLLKISMLTMLGRNVRKALIRTTMRCTR